MRNTIILSMIPNMFNISKVLLVLQLSLLYHQGKNTLDFGSGPQPVFGKILEEKYGFNVDLYDYYFSPEKVYIGNKYDLITCTEVIKSYCKSHGLFLFIFRTFKRKWNSCFDDIFSSKRGRGFF